MTENRSDLSVKIGNFTLKNPLIMASGTFGFGEEFSEFYDVSRLGGISCKGLTLYPREGNKGQRMWETPSGMLNSVGLQNPGVQEFIRTQLPYMRTLGTLPIVNLSGSCEEDYTSGATMLEDAGVEMIELNISCPNVKSGGMAFGIHPATAHDLVKKVRAVLKRTHLMVKLSPNALDIVEMAQACEAAGADSLSLVNTFKAMAIDVYKRKPVFDNVTAGLSGPAIRPIAVRMVYEVAKEVSVPVIGLGGVMNWMDVVEFIMAGATAVQIGTANFIRPELPLEILSGLENYCMREKIRSLDKIRGIV